MRGGFAKKWQVSNLSTALVIVILKIFILCVFASSFGLLLLRCALPPRNKAKR